MIKVVLNMETREFYVDGHADNDVCVSVSCLMGTLAAALEKMGIRNKVRLEKGVGMVACYPKKDKETQAGIAYATIYSGMESLAETYPDQITVEMKV